tara:strand:+ start:4131 stop:4772 length:642 start_codon:yes stop_codon:yes gene_type:complete
MRKSLVFGGTSTDLLASFSQSDINQSWCWKMSQTSFEWADPTLLEVLPQSGMTSSGRLYQLHNVEHPTLDAGGLQSPTQAPLDTTCRTLWHLENSLTVDGLLPTPTKSGAEHRTQYNQGGRPLMYMIQKGLLTTPTVNESKNNPSGASQWARHNSLNVEAAKLQGLNKTTGKDFRLNPLFVEEMMGFPIGWTDLEHSETLSSHNAPNGLDNKS